MHGHDRKLDRARTERIELMEVCPVCGDQRRNSARFCTTCGHRFIADEIENTPLVPSSVSASLDVPESADPVISGWPAPTAPAASSPWAPPAAAGGWPSPPAAAPASNDSTEVTWAEVAATALGGNRLPEPVAAAPTSSEPFDELAVIDDMDADAALSDQRNDVLLRQRARALLQELQETLEGLTGSSSTANDDLAGELEISLTRPAALDGDAIADLRAAAEGAHSRPRDLDSLTALTAQADTVLALIVGYERTTAGIERAIESLRGGSQQSEQS
jgi:hypothetical protein